MLRSNDIQTPTPINTGFKMIRQLTGLTVRSFAKELNISHTYWGDLESGIKKNPSREIIKRISDVTGLSVDAVEFLTQNNDSESGELYSVIVCALEKHIENLRLNELSK